MPAEIGHVCFVGAGTMGCYNALLSAIGGHRAVLYDVSEQTLDAVAFVLPEMARQLVEAGVLQAEDIAEALTQISSQSDLSKALDGAWLVSESVFEDVALKSRVFAELEQNCGEDVLLTSNSSALLPSDIESALTHGDRFAALHSHLGAMLFDIVGGPRTSTETVSRLKDYVLSLGGFTLIQEKENRGYVFNAMIGPVLSVAMFSVASGAETISDIDRAWMLRTGAPMGPFGLIDLFGTRLIYDSWHKRPPDPQMAIMREMILSLLAPIVGSGRLGIQSGAGFYDYPEPAYAKPGFLKGQAETTSADYALTSAWTQNAVLLAVNEIASPEDIDRAWMVATRQSKGPFGVLDEIGLDRALILFTASGPMVSPEDHARILKYLAAKVSQGQTGKASGSGVYDYPGPAYQSGEFLSLQGAQAQGRQRGDIT
ncbi:3-hydroxyacyl-CoA dehydrogenase NAD-binding domain-containing protein [Hyphomonas sp.]|jgi:enoyl-CoA hydratase/3-hydroxyacyl-CoA dehydrogenase|uniref:3-hydroxyacyl-CoA dehydrogenase n=1 Tax=Hyphomonas sp. TaxID=87 RepID=UPI0039E5D429